MSDQWNIVNFSDVHKFTSEINAYQEGAIADGDFLPQRLANGIYGQRQDNAYMVRIKLPAGDINVDQLSCIGELIEKYSDIEFSSITTRQDIQLHFVPLENISEVLLKLADVGLTTREACGNTVRNITACPLAGQCEKEHIDVRPALNEAVKHFMRHALTQYMPRKVKMSFSGCEQDCALSMIHDVGVIAIKRDEQVGYQVRVGGGLGHKPRKSILVEDFVTEDKLQAVIETVVTLHNRHSDRKRRAKSRIKFLIEKFGEDGFREKYRDAFEEVSLKIKSASTLVDGESVDNSSQADTARINATDINSADSIALNNVYKSIEIELPIGDLSIQQIKKLTGILKKYNFKQLRVTQTQNLILMDVVTSQYSDIKSELIKHGFNSHKFSLSKKTDVIACPGEWTCRLGITSSRRLAKKLNDGGVDMRIHISGCHNGCAQPQLADIGLHGEARRMFGKLIPYYRMYFGGSGKQDGDFGLKGPEVPASRVEHAVRVVQRTFSADHVNDETFTLWSRRKGISFFTELLEDVVSVTADDLPFLLKDVGDEKEFKVLQLGGGECAGISEETVSSQLAETTYEKEFRDIFVRQNKIESAIDCAENMLRLVGKSILFQQGSIVGKELPEIFRKLSSNLTSYPRLATSFDILMKETEMLRKSEDAEAFQRFSEELDAWVASLVSEDNKLSLDAYLFVEDEKTIDAVKVKTSLRILEAEVDLTDEVCPMHYIKARQALRSIEEGQVLKIGVKSGEDERLVSESLMSVGFNLLKTESTEGKSVLYVEKPVIEPLPLNQSSIKKDAGIEVA